jgi:hypothetical protein
VFFFISLEISIWGQTNHHRKSRDRSPFLKYVMCMRNRKLRNIRPSGAFSPEMTPIMWRTGRGPVRKYVLRMPGFSPRFFLSSSTVVTWLPDVTEGHLTPSGFPWVCACGTSSSSCATPIVTEGHVTPSEVSLGCSLGRPHTQGNP